MPQAHGQPTVYLRQRGKPYHMPRKKRHQYQIPEDLVQDWLLEYGKGRDYSISIEEVVSGIEDDSPSPEDAADSRHGRTKVLSLLKFLNERERFVILARLYGSTFERIGDILGVSRGRALQIEAKATSKLSKMVYYNDPVCPCCDGKKGWIVKPRTRFGKEMWYACRICQTAPPRD